MTRARPDRGAADADPADADPGGAEGARAARMPSGPTSTADEGEPW